MLFRERLSVPVLWWVLAVGFALSLLVAVGFYLGAVWGVAAAATGLLAATGLFARAGIVILVDLKGIRIGRAQIDHGYIAGCRALDAESTRRRAGVEADARAHLVLRPYVATAVEITLDDPADPVPYWLVSSRRPKELAEVVAAAIGRPPGANDLAAGSRGEDDAPDQTAEPRLTE